MCALHDFQAIAPGVAQKNAGHARFLIGGVGHLGGAQHGFNCFQVGAGQRHMPLVARHEVSGYANVKLFAVGQQEPRATIFLQRSGLLQFAQAQQVAKKLPGGGLASGGGFNQYMVQSSQQWHSANINPDIAFPCYFCGNNKRLCRVHLGARVP